LSEGRNGEKDAREGDQILKGGTGNTLSSIRGVTNWEREKRGVPQITAGRGQAKKKEKEDNGNKGGRGKGTKAQSLIVFLSARGERYKQAGLQEGKRESTSSLQEKRGNGNRRNKGCGLRGKKSAESKLV